MANFEESAHPRGQPENAGEFAPKSGGQATNKDTGKAPGASQRGQGEAGEPIRWAEPDGEQLTELSDWMRRVDPAELETMRAYTDYATSQRVNPQLRNCPEPPHTCLDDEARAMNDTVTAVIRKAGRRIPPVSAYRGVDSRFAGQVLENARACIDGGKPMRLHGITSLSVDPRKAVEYSKIQGGVILQVQAHTGAYVEPITQAPGEFELMHPHGRAYAVHSVVEGQQIEGPDGQFQSMTVIRMTEIVGDFQ